MKTALSLSLLSLIISPLLLSNTIPESVQSKKNTIRLYPDSHEMDNRGYGNWNPHQDGEFLMIKNFIKPGDMVIDAGAHKGEWSELVLEHTANNCTLYSFEPVPHFFNQLCDVLETRAQCVLSALGNQHTEHLMHYYYEESEGCSSLFNRKVLNDIPVKKIMVPVTTLDSFCETNAIDSIQFLKIDTEGSEWDVLQGAHQLISAQKINVIQFEYGGTYPDAEITLKQVYDYLTEQKYTIFRITADGLIHIPAWRNELENFHLSNYLAVLNDK